jgi:dTDP-4-amino-4,6-dideoxygalactose transaminase
MREVISLPIYPELTDAQQDEVVAAVREFYG